MHAEQQKNQSKLPTIFYLQNIADDHYIYSLTQRFLSWGGNEILSLVFVANVLPLNNNNISTVPAHHWLYAEEKESKMPQSVRYM